MAKKTRTLKPRAKKSTKTKKSVGKRQYNKHTPDFSKFDFFMPRSPNTKRMYDLRIIKRRGTGKIEYNKYEFSTGNIFEEKGVKLKSVCIGKGSFNNKQCVVAIFDSEYFKLESVPLKRMKDYYISNSSAIVNKLFKDLEIAEKSAVVYLNIEPIKDDYKKVILTVKKIEPIEN